MWSSGGQQKKKKWVGNTFLTAIVLNSVGGCRGTNPQNQVWLMTGRGLSSPLARAIRQYVYGKQ